MSIRIQGGDRGFGQLKDRLRRAPAQARTAVAFGSYAAMQEVMIEAKARAPKDTEAMAKSGYVAKPKMTAHSTTVESGFGGDSEMYVVRQHEHLGLNHPNGGEAKWFERSVDGNQAEIKQEIARWVKYFLKTGKLLPMPTKQVPESPWEDRVPGLPRAL